VEAEQICIFIEPCIMRQGAKFKLFLKHEEILFKENMLKYLILVIKDG